MTVGTQWEIGPDSRVIYHQQDEFDPPRLFMADASNSVVLVAPSDRQRYREFTSFLLDLAEAARELASDCQAAEPVRRP